MRAVTISVGKFNVVLAAGKADTIQLKVAGKTTDTPVKTMRSNNGDNHLFIRGVHEPNLCPECLRPGSLSEART